MGANQEKKGIWVFIEQEGGCLAEVSLELLQAAQTLAQKIKRAEVGAVLLGYKIKGLASSLFSYGAEKIFVADHPALENYLTLPYTRVVCQLIEEKKPEIFLWPASSIGSDLAARVAARIHTGLSAHCTSLDIDEKGRLKQIVPAFGGKVMATIICPVHNPQMATIRPGVYRRPNAQDKHGEIEEISLKLRPEDWRQRVLEIHQEKTTTSSLEEAEVVVAGGAGIGNKADWPLVEKLAQVLGGAVGGTRPPLDEGWIREEQMIGQSGKTIRPKLYIGIGISGVIQHVVGIQEAKTIIAINKDPQAAIFKTADLGVVADFRKILPLLISALEKK